ncbi:MAG: tetratricopeptide repeat protein [Maioricimonas sp. JB049]
MSLLLVTVVALARGYRGHDPDRDLHALLQEGLRWARSGDWEHVRVLAGRLSDSPDGGRAAELLFALESLEHGHPRRALRQLPVPGQDARVDAAAWPVRTDALYRLGHLREAEQVVRGQLAGSPENPLVHRWLAIIYYDLGAMDPAVRALRTLTDLRPDDASPHFMLGRIFDDYERFTEAVTAWQEFLALAPGEDPRREEALLRLANGRMRLRDYRGALEPLAVAAPTGDSLGRIAECQWNLGLRDEAAQTLDEARQSGLAGPRLKLVRSQIALETQKYDVAVELLSAVVDEEPHNLQARHLLAQACSHLGDEEAAAAARDRYRESERLLNELAELHRTAVLDVWNAELRDRLAELCRELGRPQLAAMWRQAADACRRREADPRRADGAVRHTGPAAGVPWV